MLFKFGFPKRLVQPDTVEMSPQSARAVILIGIPPTLVDARKTQYTKAKGVRVRRKA